MVKGHNLNVGDVVRNKFVPSLIGTVIEDRGDGVVRVKVGDNPSVFDVGACWERIKSSEGVGDGR